MFLEYLKLGTEHILDPNGIDHVLFLVVLTILYDRHDWKKVLWLATAFTLGHSITLACAALNIISVDSKLVEIMIAASIAITALANLLSSSTAQRQFPRYAAALVFGLIHGLGFSGFFRTILGDDHVVQPLFAFNIGVEVAQIICVLLVMLLSFILTELLPIKKKHLVTGTSLIVFIYAIKLILERL